MSKEQWAGFNRLMDVLEATGRVPQGGSRTAFAGEAMEQMRQDAKGVVAKTVETVMSPHTIGRRLSTYMMELKYGKHAEKLAEIITSPDGMAKLKELRTLSPNSVKARQIVGQLLAVSGASQVSEPDDVAPGGFSAKKANPQK